MAIVVLAEKPSVARDIAQVLGANRRGDGYLYNDRYVVTWALGHLVSFSDPNQYGSAWSGRWSFSQLPMIPTEWKLEVIERTKSQYDIVKRLITSPETSELICATDAGREGENIFRLIYAHTGCTKPFRRLWVSSLTDEALTEGLAHLHPGSAFDDLAAAAKARAQADWLVGLNMTRAYTVRNGALYTIGRVQTPTLGMIVAREILITQFNKAFYYEIEAGFTEGFAAKYLHSDEKGKETRIEPKALAERLHARFKEHTTGLVKGVEKKVRNHKPPQLYDLITLQKDANDRFSLTASDTLAVAQKLYEQYKLITYPRTESRHLSEDMVSQLPQILKSVRHPMAQEALRRLEAGLKLSKQYVDKTKLSDHHGIIPTPKVPPPNLPRDLQNIYDLVVTRFVAMFLPDHVVEETTALVEIDQAIFRARGAIVLEEGWKEAEPKRDGRTEKDRALPPLKAGQTVHIERMDLQEKETAPPKRFTDATLLTAMKNAGREVEDETLALAMKEQGLGTPATRAEIIEKLVRTHLIERRKKVLYPTTKGMSLIGVVHDMLKSPELTGKWEQKLKDIENGEYPVDRFNFAIETFVRKLIPKVATSPVLTYRDPQKGESIQSEPPPDGDDDETSEDQNNPSTSKSGKAKPKTRNPSPSPSAKAAKAAKSPAQPKTAAKEARAKAQADPAQPASCPKCNKGSIIEGRAAFGCNRYREGCQFTVPKVYGGRTLSPRQLDELLTKGKTSFLKGWTDADGQTFDAKLVLTDQAQLEFDRTPPTKRAASDTLRCPRCSQGDIIEGKTGFGCNRFREGCRLVVPKEVAGRLLTPAQIKALLTKGETPVIKGFTDEAGRDFSAVLRFNAQYQVQIQPQTT